MSSWRAALRIARRDARRAKGRSALVIAMIALPVMGMGALDVVARTYQLSPDQRADRKIGQADVGLRDTGSGGPIEQYDHGYSVLGDDASKAGPADLGSLVPAGSRTLMDISLFGTVATADRTARVELRALAIADPLASGIYHQVSGREPRALGETALTTALAKRLDAHVGDEVTIAQTGGVSRVVGIVANGSDTGVTTALVAPSALALDSVGLDDTTPSVRVLADLPTGLDAAFTHRANAVGVFVEGRGQVPGAVDAPWSETGPGAGTLTAVGLVAGMALLEIVLLAGPAFAVGVKRQSRDLALLSAVGGERRDVRRVVLGGGLVVGGVAGVLGVAGGIVVALAGLPLVGHFDSMVPGPWDVRPLELLAIALVGVLTALLAALLPARIATRLDVVAALTGRRGSTRSSRRVPMLGLAATALGTLIALQGARSRDLNIVLAGSIVAELGLVALTPILVGAAGRLGRFLPLAPRLALRDASRNRTRTAPAVAAVLAAVAGSVAVATVLGSVDAKDRAAYDPAGVKGSVQVQFGSPADAARLTELQSAVARHLPVRTITPITTATGLGDARTAYVSLAPPARCAEAGCPELGYTSHTRGLAVGDAKLVEALTGARGPEIDAALAAGAVLVPEAYLQPGGTAVIQLVNFPGAGSAPVPAPGSEESPALARQTVPPDSREVTLPAVALPAGTPHVEPVLSVGAAATLGLKPVVTGLAVETTRMPTGQEEDAARSAVNDLGATVGLIVERGYQSNYGWPLLVLTGASAVLVLGASGIATGLASADGRADLATLAAVGATPGTRRRLAGFQSIVTAGMGTALGVVAGLVPAVGFIGALNTPQGERTSLLHSGDYPFVLPWRDLLITVVVVPLVAALAAVLFTRSRLPLVRRPA